MWEIAASLQLHFTFKTCFLCIHALFFPSLHLPFILLLTHGHSAGGGTFTIYNLAISSL